MEGYFVMIFHELSALFQFECQLLLETVKFEVEITQTSGIELNNAEGFSLNTSSSRGNTARNTMKIVYLMNEVLDKCKKDSTKSVVVFLVKVRILLNLYSTGPYNNDFFS